MLVHCPCLCPCLGLGLCAWRESFDLLVHRHCHEPLPGVRGVQEEPFHASRGEAAALWKHTVKHLDLGTRGRVDLCGDDSERLGRHVEEKQIFELALVDPHKHPCPDGQPLSHCLVGVDGGAELALLLSRRPCC